MDGEDDVVSGRVPCAVSHYMLITVPARRFFKRGHLTFRFDEPGFAYGNTKKGRSIPVWERGHQISTVMLAGGAGIGMKDITDRLSGAICKSYQSDFKPVRKNETVCDDRAGSALG